MQKQARETAMAVEEMRRRPPPPPPKRYPLNVAMWHAKFKDMPSWRFFQLSTQDPEMLPAYMQQARRELIMDEEDPVVGRTAELLRRLLLDGPTPEVDARPVRVVDLGCGEAALASELMSMSWPEGQTPSVTSVDAAPLAPSVEVYNIGKLPNDWAGRFDIVVLCRALWGTDFPRVLGEARRVLRSGSASRLVIVEPFRRWWGRDKVHPKKNALPEAVESAGFSLDGGLCVDIEPRPAAPGEGEKQRMQGVFQFVVAEPV